MTTNYECQCPACIVLRMTRKSMFDSKIHCHATNNPENYLKIINEIDEVRNLVNAKYTALTTPKSFNCGESAINKIECEPVVVVSDWVEVIPYKQVKDLKFDPGAHGITPEVWNDWVKSKKTTKTDRVLSRFVRVCDEIGMTYNNGMKYWLESGYTGFYPPKNYTPNNQNNDNPATPDYVNMNWYAKDVIHD